ncbi:hypothetical protein MSMTP_2670 [Methanosarcina sp. MTP4]|uniref:hypothetical protein n=1 Tax=Methanosarcina sp. MTP4 TaxID=1434100 RepID=UPI0006154FF3|nr:hypothetical protein [Methanosarcina sp. MTP4]AKB26139.1 hypothetical protein MSMTP_2670 [Methanosarcina sp. MTP4]
MKTKEILKPILTGIFLLLFVSNVGLGALNSSLIEELSVVDAFHPPGEGDPVNLYNEWHYFNVIDEEQNLSVTCTFKLNGALNASEVMLGYSANATNATNVTTGLFYGVYPLVPGVVEYSSESPNVTISNSSVTLTDQGYVVYVESDDGTKVFDALFVPEVEPSPAYNISGVPVPGTETNGLITSAKMTVNGTLTVDGQTYAFDQRRGYHDHNWGYWSWDSDFGWERGQVIQLNSSSNESEVGEYSLSFGNITNASHTQSAFSLLSVWKGENITASFSGDELKIEHNLTSFNETFPIPDQGIGLPIASFPLPVDTSISASNALSPDANNLEIGFNTEQSVLVPIVIVDESGNVKFRVLWGMIGNYQVNGTIGGDPVSYTADGFMEYVSGMPVSPVAL